MKLFCFADPIAASKVDFMVRIFPRRNFRSLISSKILRAIPNSIIDEQELKNMPHLVLADEEIIPSYNVKYLFSIEIEILNFFQLRSRFLKSL